MNCVATNSLYCLWVKICYLDRVPKSFIKGLDKSFAEGDKKSRGYLWFVNVLFSENFLGDSEGVGRPPTEVPGRCS